MNLTDGRKLKSAHPEHFMEVCANCDEREGFRNIVLCSVFNNRAHITCTPLHIGDIMNESPALLNATAAISGVGN